MHLSISLHKLTQYTANLGTRFTVHAGASTQPGRRRRRVPGPVHPLHRPRLPPVRVAGRGHDLLAAVRQVDDPLVHVPHAARAQVDPEAAEEAAEVDVAAVTVVGADGDVGI